MADTTAREKEKMHSGQLYDPGNEEIMQEQLDCMERLYEYNLTRPHEQEKRQQMLRQMFAEIGPGC